MSGVLSSRRAARRTTIVIGLRSSCPIPICMEPLLATRPGLLWLAGSTVFRLLASAPDFDVDAIAFWLQVNGKLVRQPDVQISPLSLPTSVKNGESFEVRFAAQAGSVVDSPFPMT